MSRFSISPASLLCLAIASLMGGCASNPMANQAGSNPPPATIASCNDLRNAITVAEAARHEAAQRGDNAWKAVVPVAVVARYASSKKAGSDATERLAELQAAADRKGCARP
jgi:hypothetical protein